MTTARRPGIIQACAFGAVGLLGVGFGILDLVRNPQQPLPWEFALVILFLVMAAQFAVGVSKEARDWVYWAFGSVLMGGILLPWMVESAVESVLSRSILAATAVAMLLVAVGWRLSHARRSQS